MFKTVEKKHRYFKTLFLNNRLKHCFLYCCFILKKDSSFNTFAAGDAYKRPRVPNCECRWRFKESETTCYYAYYSVWFRTPQREKNSFLIKIQN